MKITNKTLRICITYAIFKVTSSTIDAGDGGVIDVGIEKFVNLFAWKDATRSNCSATLADTTNSLVAKNLSGGGGGGGRYTCVGCDFLTVGFGCISNELLRRFYELVWIF